MGKRKSSLGSWNLVTRQQAGGSHQRQDAQCRALLALLPEHRQRLRQLVGVHRLGRLGRGQGATLRAVRHVWRGRAGAARWAALRHRVTAGEGGRCANRPREGWLAARKGGRCTVSRMTASQLQGAGQCRAPPLQLEGRPQQGTALPSARQEQQSVSMATSS